MIGNFFVECTKGQPGAPFIVCGDLAEHDASYYRGYYASRWPGAEFAVKEHGKFVCPHGVPSRGFCQKCDG